MIFGRGSGPEQELQEQSTIAERVVGADLVPVVAGLGGVEVTLFATCTAATALR